jgi:phosphoglycerate dehydrogenase-like enzyme
VADGTFEQLGSGIREVAGATVGIIGYGGIGRAVARRAIALGMNVLALRRSDRATTEPGVEMHAGADALRTLLERSDVVVVCVPSTPATRDMIGARELAWLRRDAILINVARGDVIDEAALGDALQAGRLRGAALDVFRTEPLPAESPLWSLDERADHAARERDDAAFLAP